jgi:hypothetical protein
VTEDTETVVPDESSLPTWDEISPETLRRASAEATPHRDPKLQGLFDTHAQPEGQGAVDAVVKRPPREDVLASGVEWFTFTLGVLLGMASSLGAFQWSGGKLGPFVAVPAIVFAVPLIFMRRKDLRSIALGLLVSLPTALALGLVLWYVALSV